MRFADLLSEAESSDCFPFYLNRTNTKRIRLKLAEGAGYGFPSNSIGGRG